MFVIWRKEADRKKKEEGKKNKVDDKPKSATSAKDNEDKNENSGNK